MQTIDLSVAQWREMALSGADLPVKFMVNGSSMHPLIRKNRDVVTVVPLRRAPRVGEIVLFYRRTANADYVIHRVSGVNDAMVQTIGDNCFTPDPWMPISSLCGLVTKVSRGRFRFNPSKLVWRALLAVWHLRRRVHNRIKASMRMIVNSETT